MENQTDLSIAIKNGLIAGFCAIILMLVLYLVNPVLFVSFWSMLIYTFVIALMIITGITVKKNKGGFIAFKQALKFIYLTAIISVTIYTIFSFLMFKVIDPDLVDKLKEFSLGFTEKIMEFFGAPESQIEQALEQAGKEDYSPTVGNQMKGLLFNYIMGFIISSIIALMVRKNPPEELLKVDS